MKRLLSSGIGNLATAMVIVIFTGESVLAATRESLDRSTRTFIDQASKGESEAALASARALSQPTEPGLEDRLKSVWATLNSDPATPNDSGRAVLTEESYLGACIHRTYTVRSRDSKQFWHVSFRNGVGGWRLSDVSIRPRR